MAIVLGLTGGIASGKSTVSNMLKKMKFPVVDADVIAREVVEIDEPAYQEIIQVFGEGILLENLDLDRAKLGEIIFNDPKKREMLNRIVHPAVRKRMLELKDRYFSMGENTVILDIPLLFESKLTHMVDKTILVFVEENVQLERLMERNGLSEQEARARISSQLPLREKISMADAVLDNNGSIEDTEQQLKELLAKWGIMEY